MTSGKQRLGDYLQHIVEAIERVQRYTEDADEVRFIGDEMMQDAVIRNLEVIGEASRNIEREHPGFAAAHPELPLSFAYEMRNVLSLATSKLISASCGKPSSVTCPCCCSKLK